MPVLQLRANFKCVGLSKNLEKRTHMSRQYNYILLISFVLLSLLYPLYFDINISSYYSFDKVLCKC